jgi:hypothetical protein
MIGYSFEVENQMLQFYESLSEKDKRRYAAVESMKLAHGKNISANFLAAILRP